MSDLIEKLEAWTYRDDHPMQWNDGADDMLDLVKDVLVAAEERVYRGENNVDLHQALADLRAKLEDKCTKP